ncbi:MAG: capsule assembly Wzi family protein, partial [Muribaculaceae bacterium]|nr:capsule assembly Wzi family protein [Muribaculaceae bacterium]
MRRFISTLLLTTFTLLSLSAFELDWNASTTVNVGSGPFAPSLIMANRGGTVTQSKGIYQRASIECPLHPERRFSYAFGADGIIGATSAVDYARWDKTSGDWTTTARRPAVMTLQQLYGEVKYRSLFLLVGMKENDRTFLNNPLSSGDLTVSNNARPIP